jgi:hypothetical protein
MQPNTSITRRKSAAKPRKATGDLKRDINLLPANENSEKVARIGTIALAVFMGLLLLSYFAIILPGTQLKAAQDRADGLSAQATAKAGASAQFSARIAQRNAKQSTLETLNNAKKAYNQPSDLQDLISRACPNSITIYSLVFSDAGATIQGQAPDDREVAQFIANLKTTTAFGGVELSSDQESNASLDPAQKRLFEITAAYPPAATPTPAPTPAATQEGGAGA